MPIGVIEINDAGVRAGIDGEIVLTSPGYAVLDGRELLVGEDGIRNSRLLPRWTNNRFWNNLNTDPVPNGTDMVRHHADIAFAHLEQVWKTIRSADKVILAVPGFYDRNQLGLLLGMAQECGIPVTSLVDTSLATVSNLEAHPTVLHLEIYLHRITLSVLKSDSMLRGVENITISEAGLFTLWDRWANTIASQFIQSSRYDPMHHATSEQQLFDRLPAWIANLPDERSAIFELEAGGTRQQIAISREQLVGACASIYPQIVQLARDFASGMDRASLFVSHRFTGFPGLRDSLSLIDNVEVQWLPPEATFTSIAAHQDTLIGQGSAISHITSLPVRLTRPATSPEQAPQRRASHLLEGSHAIAIGHALGISLDADGELRIGEDDPALTLYNRGNQTIIEVASGHEVLLNAAPARSGTAVDPGDELSLGGHNMMLISAG